MHKWGTAVLAVLHLSHCKLSLSNGNSKAGLPLPTLKEAGEGPIRITLKLTGVRSILKHAGLLLKKLF